MKHTYEIDAEDKQTFLECLRQGMRPNQAAKEIPTTGTRIRRLRNPEAEHYDPEFAAAWEEIENSPAARRELEERIRDMVHDSAEEGNWNARWKLALTYLPEFEWAKHANLNVNMRMQVLTQALPGLTMEELERVQAALAKGEEPKQLLEAVPDVIEAA